jgi:hypothetical protein
MVAGSVGSGSGLVGPSSGSGSGSGIVAGSLPRQSLSLGSGPVARPSPGVGASAGTGVTTGTSAGSTIGTGISRPSSGLSSGLGMGGPRLSHLQTQVQGHMRSTSASSLSPTSSFFTSTPPKLNVPLPSPTLPGQAAQPPFFAQPLSSQAPFPPQSPVLPSHTSGQLPTHPKRPMIYPSPFKSNTVNTSSSSSPAPAGVGSYSHAHAHSYSGSGTGTGTGLPLSLSDRVSLHDRISLSEREGRRSLDFSAGGVSVPFSREGHAEDPSHGPTHTQGQGQSTSIPPRKRYSSSFGHRYAAVGQGLPGSAGSTGSGVSPGGVAGAGSVLGGEQHKGKEKEKLDENDHDKEDPAPSSAGVGASLGARRRSTPSHSSSFLTSGSGDREKDRDDEDISVFVQDIDSAKPLVGRGRGRERGQERGKGGGRQKDEIESENENDGSEGADAGRRLQAQAQSPLRSGSRPPQSSSPLSSPPTTLDPGKGTEGMIARSPPPGMMLTSEREVDEKLRKMNEVFLKSLEGLGGGSGVGGERSREGQRSIGLQRERERTSTFYGEGVVGESERERERTTSLSGRYSTLGYGRFRGGSDAAVSAGAAEAGGAGSGLSRARSAYVPALPTTRNNIPGSQTGINTTSFPPVSRPSSRTGNVYAHGFGSEEVIGKLELDSESGSGSGSGGGTRFGRGAGGRFDF